MDVFENLMKRIDVVSGKKNDRAPSELHMLKSSHGDGIRRWGPLGGD